MEQQPTVVFLDLEETCIDDWAFARLLGKNLDRIKQFIDHLQETEECGVRVGLMSWAVHHMIDKVNFNTRMRHLIERQLGHGFSDHFLWSMKEWADILFKECGIHMEYDELFDMFQKEEVLYHIARKGARFQNRRVILIDDKVLSTKIQIPSRNMSIELIRLEDLFTV